MPDQKYFSEKQAARLLNIAPKTLRNWRVKGFGPKFVKASNRLIRYRQTDIDDWMENNIRTSTSDNGVLPRFLRK